jgi:hypothetical protein
MNIPTPDKLFVRNDLRRGPNCGVTAVAVVAGITFNEAFYLLRKIGGRTRRWKGSTTVDQRAVALEQLGVQTKAWRLRDKMRLETWIRVRAEPGKTYMVRTTGHVQVVRDGWVMDQSGLWRYGAFGLRKKLVSHVTEVL